MADYPVMFTVRDVVSGNGYLAGVTLSGRAIMCKEEEDGKWWVYGVRPGAVAENGSTPEEAFGRFRNTYKNVLFDMAEESPTYEAFREAVENFYYQPDPDEEERWEAAFKAIRTGAVVPEGVFFSKMPKQAPETRPTQLTVERLDKENARYKPTDNVTDYFALPTAA
jgi:predicted RNase H-like HicB family nuclease